MKNFIIELLDTLDQTGTDPGTKVSILKLIQKHKLDQTQEPAEQQEQNLLTVAEWNALGYKGRAELYDANREAYDAALVGKFKGEN